MTTIKVKFAEMPRDCADLVAMHPPRPLHEDVDEQNVQEIVNERRPAYFVRGPLVVPKPVLLTNPR